ncbi:MULTISPECIES: sodium:calcium antiporter [unclassified Sphingosinithalassobacter]|uniref:sodium:calcium antiporter n=1 Tax=unclassified Sphingosinithalassobacter TaxID=2676235 RepID=UPI00165E4BB4|nr:sodium:calcium antiporter [Sphingosinithalassobacter sp. CS137]
MPVDLASLSLVLLLAIFVGAGVVVWQAGTRMTRLVDTFAERTGLGQAFAGMLLLGGITSLPEVATVGTASATGNPALAVNNLLGSASINILLLAIADLVFGKDALTSRAARPATLMQGTFGMVLLSGVAIACVTGDFEVPYLGTGIGTLVLAFGCIQALRISARFEREHVWEVVNQPENRKGEREKDERPTGRVILWLVVAAVSILVAGSVLSLTGDAIAQKTGLGASMVGFALVGLGTSLPELSSIFAALRLRRYEMAIGDIFGTNLFNVQLLLLADLVYRDGPVLANAGTFEVVAAGMATIMTGVFVLGLLERRDKTILRMGHDSAIVLLVFGSGLFLLSRFI